MNYVSQTNDGRHVEEVILHCAATPTGFWRDKSGFQAFAEVNEWHVKRGWKGFGYHGLIMPDGEWHTGRRFDHTGAHTAGHNRNTIGILLCESTKITFMGQFHDWFTQEQAVSLRRVLSAIPGIEHVSGHNDYAAKLCPGFKVKSSDWLS